MPLLVLDRISVAFGHLPLVDGATLQIDRGERVALIGRNGSGKSTLLRVISGEQEPDTGTRWVQPAVTIARLEQDVPLATDRSVFEVVSDGLGHLSALVGAYHEAARRVATSEDPAALARLGQLQHELEEQDAWRLEQRVEDVLSRLTLPADAIVDTLSGGWRRRVLLARALVTTPDVLLLDEPTNHLDIDTIAWLETLLADYAGAVLFVTHDRAFLRRLATRIVELDRGRLTSWPGDYDTFLRKKEEWIANQALHETRFDKKLAEEEAWLRQGIKARRTRNEGRVRALMAMREQRAARRADPGAARIRVATADSTGRMVFEADDVSVELGGVPIAKHLSLRVMRGDRIGLIGPNGSGKTTLLRLFLGEVQPDEGTVRQGTNLQIAYFDQQREQLDPERSVADTVAEGNDTVVVNGEPRHVIGYLGDFLFPPERARSPVKALSGGERNRLLLARLFTRPVNVLLLDEPTNDLDLETLELLEAQLVAWSGTLLLVSHDRTFLDSVVTSTLVFEGNGHIQEYVGGYEDWLRQRARRGADAGESPVTSASSPATPAQPSARKRLSYNEQRELAALPERIEALDAEQARLEALIAAPGFYLETADAIAAHLARLEAVRHERLAAYTRWDELDSRA